MSRWSLCGAILLALLASKLEAQQRVTVTAEVVDLIDATAPAFAVDRSAGTLRVMHAHHDRAASTTQVLEQVVVDTLPPATPADRLYARRDARLVPVAEPPAPARESADNARIVVTWILASNS